MQLSLRPENIARYVCAQIAAFFPDRVLPAADLMGKAVEIALQRLEYCFARIRHEAYSSEGQTYFSHLYSDQYLIFLWFLANTIWEKWQNRDLATKIYYLNKALHSFDCMYDTELPQVFFIAHGVGTVLGRATYGNYFYVSTGCVVGAHNGQYPVFGDCVGLGAGSAVIGNCCVGGYASVGSGTRIFRRDIPAGNVVYRSDDGSICIKPTEVSLARNAFRL